jgi:methionyl-tRNA formyltransferase
MKERLLFLGKQGDSAAERAAELCRLHFDVTSLFGAWGDPRPRELETFDGEVVISYLSRWIVPAATFARAPRLALNFHPAPPEYPGFGPYSFALYDGADVYGVTCHHMTPQVDAGPIVAVRRFPVTSDDTVETLVNRTSVQLLRLFEHLLPAIASGEALPSSPERWSGARRTRRELDALGVLDPSMTREEIARRVRATTFGGWKPRVVIAGFTFELKTSETDA